MGRQGMQTIVGFSQGQAQAAIAAAIAAAVTPDVPGWFAGGYYGNDTAANASSYSAAVVAANFLVALWCPIPPEGATIDRIGAEVTAFVAAKNFRVAAYKADGARRYPGSLIVDSGVLSAGANGFVEATVAVVLPGGGVWLAFQTDDGTVTYRHVASTVKLSLVGKSAGGGTTAFSSLVVAQAFGAFPATFPAGAVRNALSPVVNVRAA